MRAARARSEAHTSELQSRRDLVCRLLLEKKKVRSRAAARQGPRRAARHGLACLASFFFNDPATTEIYTLSLHDALPISLLGMLLMGLSFVQGLALGAVTAVLLVMAARSEEHTSELQSRRDLVCRLL